MTDTSPVVGIVLAAGAATRMGRPKQLLAYGGKPLLQHAIDAAEASRLERVVVVTGAGADEVESGVSPTRARFVRNPDYRRGNVSSLACGASAEPGAESYLLLMGDQPDVSSEVIDRVIDLWHARCPWAAVVAYRDRIAHPFLLSRAALDEAVVTAAAKRLWHLLAEDTTGRVVRVEAEGPAPIDVNTPQDYRRLLAERPAE